MISNNTRKSNYGNFCRPSSNINDHMSSRLFYVKANPYCSMASEVSSLVVDRGFDYLDAPIQRVGARDVPMPYNDGLEVEVIPSIDRIANAIRDVMR